MRDQPGIGAWLESRTRGIGGRFRPALMIEIRVILLLYGGGAMAGTPSRIMAVPDSTVVVRYGRKQAGAEVGCNPKKKKPGRPGHHPLVALAADTGDCPGVLWRPGSAHAAAGSIEWLRRIVGRLRGLGVHDITVRMDRGFFSKEMVRALADMDVRFFLKLPRHSWVRSAAGSWRPSAKDTDLWTATGELRGARLLACDRDEPLRKPLPAALRSLTSLPPLAAAQQVLNPSCRRPA
jgi:hypothetical protein